MKKTITLSLFIILSFTTTIPTTLLKQLKGSVNHNADVTWTIVGAGPAGIAVVGLLLDLGVDGKTITWVDPEFNIGRLGKYYYHVPGNAKAIDYIAFVNQCHTFQEYSSPALDSLRMHDPQEFCTLAVIIDPLQDLTHYLRGKVIARKNRLTELSFENEEWHITLNNNMQFTSHNVILATGSHPQTLNYPCKDEIPLDLALDKTTLTKLVDRDDTIALIGGSHSAILILKYLYELGTNRIVNFFKHPITYYFDMGEGNPTNPGGLRGTVAKWAYYTLEKEKPVNIIRLQNTLPARNSWLPICDKIIYAIGYERNEIPLLNSDNQQLDYDSTTGVISPRLFGIGIAFPEQVIDNETGNPRNLIGLLDFMTYAQQIIPEWMKKYPHKHLLRFSNLFTIALL